MPAPVSGAEAGNWIRGIRFSGFGLLMMALLVLGIVVIAPNLKAYAEQRQQIAQLQAAVDASEEEIERLGVERERWNDSTYVMTQARDRLFYVNPGEISFIVMNDVDSALFGEDEAPVSTELKATTVNWAESMLSSLVTAGLAEVSGERSTEPAPAPEPTP
ncbi:septum formation initiator family protein [Mycetocola sp. 2940]|uniref:FtsB family cell division protein n=1 Tax=Mycetocola sp. 2940 TaxID=3156452 RepID=UPI003398083E